ncbi:hypothetical protein BKA69DRAFT_1046659 [Paraphysoderma sedebokerense]|nr:hypothetical protein BKA69DRAFT_1046659 [Paraphysoderma sedebokerense]
MLKIQVLSRLYSLLLVWNYLLYSVFGTPLPIEFPPPKAQEKSNEVIKDPRVYIPETVPIGVIFILVGTLFCFWGSRWFKIVLFLAGAYIFGKCLLTIVSPLKRST